MEALTPASETSRRTEVMALPAALRPATGAGVPLSTLAAQVGAVPAEGSSDSDLQITGVTLRAQDVQPALQRVPQRDRWHRRTELELDGSDPVAGHGVQRLFQTGALELAGQNP